MPSTRMTLTGPSARWQRPRSWKERSNTKSCKLGYIALPYTQSTIRAHACYITQTLSKYLDTACVESVELKAAKVRDVIDN